MSDIYIQVRANADTKRQFEHIVNSLGLSMSGAMTVFMKATIAAGGIPFDLRQPALVSRDTDTGGEDVQPVRDDTVL